MNDLKNGIVVLFLNDSIHIENTFFLILLIAFGIFSLFGICSMLINQKNKYMVSKAQQEKKELEQEIECLKANLEEEKKQSQSMREWCEELKKVEENNRKLAMTDYITGLPNRKAFTEIMDGVLKTLRKEETIAVMYIDIDDFKKINEILGRSYGDELLIDVADRIKQVTTENDFLACFGSDEYFILTQNIDDIGEYEEKVKKIRNVFSYPFVLAGKETFVDVSIGIVFAPKDGKTTQTILRNLDYALFQAKNNGKNSYSYYDESINKELMGQIELQAQIRAAIENEEFVVYYQPQVNLETGDLNGFEAMLRWKHPTKGILLPSEFMPTAEASGLIVTIGRWAMEQICWKLKQWEDEGMGQKKIFIHLSGREFRDEMLLDFLKELLEKTKVDASQLVIGVTESVIFDSIEEVVPIIENLKNIGIACTLARFGIGYSSIHHLRQFPVTSLMIDESLLLEALEEGQEQDIIKVIILLAKACGLSVSAKGVESVEQEIFLKEAGCNIVQGFLYGEPMELSATEKLMKFLAEGGKMEDALWI